MIRSEMNDPGKTLLDPLRLLLSTPCLNPYKYLLWGDVETTQAIRLTKAMTHKVAIVDASCE